MLYDKLKDRHRELNIWKLPDQLFLVYREVDYGHLEEHRLLSECESLFTKQSQPGLFAKTRPCSIRTSKSTIDTNDEMVTRIVFELIRESNLVGDWRCQVIAKRGNSVANVTPWGNLSFYQRISHDAIKWQKRNKDRESC